MERNGRGIGGRLTEGRTERREKLEGPKETTRVEPRRWPMEKERRVKWKRDGELAADGTRDAHGDG